MKPMKPSMPPPAQRRKILLWGLAAAALAALAWLAQREPVQLASVAKVSRGPLEISFVEEGKTRLQERFVVTAPLAGVVRRITLRPGDAVQAGQTLAEINPVSSALLDPRARSAAQADIGSADSAARAARQRTLAAATAQEVAQSNFMRQQQLHAAGMASPAQLDTARAQAGLASAELDTARADEQIAQRRLQTARAVLGDEGRSATGASAKVVAVPAPVGGLVIERVVESATPVAMGQRLMDIGNPAALEIEVQALSTDAVRLQPGMKARLLRWGGEGVLDASVRRIEPGGFTKVSALGVEEQRTRVLLNIDSPHERWTALGDAFRVEVEFILSQQAAVLQVPASALFRAGEGWAVYRVDSGVARRTPVRLGARSATSAQVLEGLQENQQVVVQPDDRIKDATRIKAVALR
jgi:HlyD family secretion protein